MMNKRTFSTILILLFLFTVSYSNAQIKFGGKVGYSIGKLSDNSNNIYSKDFKSVSGIDFGLSLEVPVNELFSVQTELNFTQRGGERNGMQPVPLAPIEDALADLGFTLEQLNGFIVANGGEALTDANPLYANYNNQTILKYLEIPVLAKFGWGSDWRFYAEIGPFIGFLLNSELTTSGTSQFYFDSQGNRVLQIPNPFYNPETPETGPPFIDFPEQDFQATSNPKDDLNVANAGMQAGLGVIKKLNQQHEVYLGLRASYGFIPLQKNSVFGESKVGGIIISAGYVYTLNKK